MNHGWARLYTDESCNSRDAFAAEKSRDLEDCIRDGVLPESRFTARTVELIEDPGTHSPASIKKLRASLGVSQNIFAIMLGVSCALVESWEQGLREPSPLARRLLDTVSADPGA